MKQIQNLIEKHKIISNEITLNYLSFYYLVNLKKILHVLQITLSMKEQKINQNYLTKNEDFIFSFWAESEFGKDFLESSSRWSMKKKSLFCCHKALNQLFYFAKVHFYQDKKALAFYKPVTEIGDHFNVLSLKNKENFLIYQDNLFHLYLNFNLKTKEYLVQKNRIITAIDKIKKYSYSSYQLLTLFTHTIVPTKERGIVSYSSQDLPGYSTINLWHRDDLDLLDDLLHENGHHHLNTYLNKNHLINEDDDFCYYSPWRKSYRPIRGIYHAFFTFYWAYQLYKDLLRHKNSFNLHDQKKIAGRFCEEFIMLSYCIPCIKHAVKENKIESLGYKILRPIILDLNQEQISFAKAKKSLNHQWKKRIKDLEINLKEHLPVI